MTTSRPLVLVESPFSHPHAAGRQLYRAYLELCLLDAIKRNEVPIATHKLYTDCLDDTIPEERELGMAMLRELMAKTDYHVVYFDFGISAGMQWGIEEAIKANKTIEFRSLYDRDPSLECNNTPEVYYNYITRNRPKVEIDDEIPF